MGAFLEVFNKLSIQQKIMIGASAVVGFILLGFVLFVFNEPSYTTLYSKLTEEDASAVVQELASKKIPYKITDGGTTIKVPKDKVYEVRFSMASKGIPNSGVMGYEIFDKNTMGMSEFMQKLNYKRALEGELAKTIMTLSGIENARVHIVIPEKSVFKDEEKEPTASVNIKYNGAGKLSRKNIEAITNLVASSVEGMSPEKVAVIDNKGRLLTRQVDDNPLALSSGKQYELKGNIESYLAQKCQSILDNVLGYGSSVIKVNVDLDFKQVEKTIQSYDPETQVVISEQTTKSENMGRSVSDSNAVNTENTITNYEVSQTLEKVLEGAGTIKRITVAAMVNGVKKEVKNGDATEVIIEPRSQEQIVKLEEILKKTVGFDPGRKDEISVVSIPFENQLEQETVFANPSLFDDVGRLSNLILMFFAIVASLAVLKGLLKRLKNEKIIIGTLGPTAGYEDGSFDDLSPALPGGGNVPAGQLAAAAKNNKKALLSVGDLEDEISDSALRKKARHEKITNYVTKNPTEAAKLVNSWLREDEY